MRYPKKWASKSDIHGLWVRAMRVHYHRWRMVLRAMRLTEPFASVEGKEQGEYGA